jgi:hypothetical protein
MGILQSSGSTVVILLDLFVILEFLDPPVSETELSSLAGLDPTEQTVHYTSAKNRTVWFGKLEHPGFLENRIFLDLLKNLMIATSNHSPLYFHP